MKRFSNILAVVNTNRSGISALKQAASIARKNGASLTVASVLEELPGERWMGVLASSASDIETIAKEQELNRLTEYVSAAEGDTGSIDKQVLVGRASSEIIRQVLGGQHDLLVKDAEISDGLLDVFLGSTDMHLMRKCPCPVLISWPGRKSYRRILACIDYDPGNAQNEALNRQIVEIASSIAQRESGELHVLHAIEPIGEKFLRAANIANKGMDLEKLGERERATRNDWIANLLDAAIAKLGVDANEHPASRLHLIKGLAKEVVPMKARELESDLIVMGTLSRTGVPGYFIGNTSENILNQVRCSVLTLKPDGFVCPVEP
ncbi:MAG: universal stress protein [Xanthomonadales bacterium]|jgi:nucleotide-binding universal stress UspA family protein|nr:universal stress protein [Xanthomonadales bacterium]